MGKFGAAVKVARARYGVKQWRLAHKLEWHITTLYGVEAGTRRVSDAEREAIAAALADLAQRPVADIVAMLDEEERR